MARRKMLPAGIVMAALFALLAFAPLASAASDPVGTGSATLTLNKGFTKSLKKKGVKVLRVSPATLKGAKLSLKVTGGSIDPTTGKGSVTLGGGLKFKAGKKSATVKGLVLDTTKNSLTGNVGGRKMKFGAVSGFSQVRNGFGVNLTIKKLKLTSPAAKRLNKKLGFKKGKKPFTANKLMGSAKTEVQPATLNLVPGGNAKLTTALPTVKKLAEDNVTVIPVAPTTVAEVGPPPAFAFPISGGTLAPDATAGIVQTGGGLKLSQVFVPGTVETVMSLNAIYVDLGAKAATVEVVVESKGISEKLNLGPLGRSSIADINLTGATITSDPVTHKVTVTNATATLQAVTAEVLNSVFAAGFEGVTKTPAQKFAAGDPLGTFSFEATTE